MAKLPRTKSTKCTTEIKLQFCSRVALLSAFRSAKPERICHPTRASRRAERDGYKRKPGGKLNSPPGLKVGVVTPKAFGVVMKRGALMPLSLCFCLVTLFAFFCHRLFPPFNPQLRRVLKSSRCILIHIQTVYLPSLFYYNIC